MSFKVGDVVILKSGGPKMTVENVATRNSGQPAVWCTWFEGSKVVKDVFAVEAVKLADEK